MELEIKQDCADVNWQFIAETLKRVGMAYAEPAVHKKSFENSQVTVFIYLRRSIDRFWTGNFRRCFSSGDL